MNAGGAWRSCPSCGSDSARPLPRYAAARLARCPRCGLVFARELPSPAALAEHYAGYPACGPLSELTARRYREVLARLEPFRRTGRLLDVGCGDGHFLAAARSAGWHAYGSEYGEGPRRRARERGLDVREAPFAAVGDEQGSFDVITAFEVIEHVVAPREELARMAALLRPGGGAYLTTPNFAALSRRLAGPRWRAIGYPEHLNMFTPATLDRMLEGAGLYRLSVTTTGLSPADVWAGVRPGRRARVGGAAGAQDPGAGAAPPETATAAPTTAPPPSLDARLRTAIARSPLLDRAVDAANVALGRMRAGDTIKALYRR